MGQLSVTSRRAKPLVLTEEKKCVKGRSLQDRWGLGGSDFPRAQNQKGDKSNARWVQQVSRIMSVFAGHCVTSFPDPYDPSLTLCECETGWDGASDFFDTRIDVNGTAYSIACGNSTVNVRVVYALALFSCLYNCVNLYSVLRREAARFLRRPSRAFTLMALRVSLLDAFLATPLFIIAYSLKLQPHPPVMGSDPLVTVAMCGGAGIWTLTAADFNYAQFRAFANVMPSALSKRLTNHMYYITMAQATVYFVCSLGPSVGALCACSACAYSPPALPRHAVL